MIPNEILRPFLEKYLATNDMKVLVMKARVHQATIEKILYKNGKVHFDTADRLICALGLGGMFWNSKEVREIYKKVNLRYIDKHRPITSKKSWVYVTTAKTGQLSHAI